MQQRILGKTGEAVSILGFGCMRLPVAGPDPSCIDEAPAIAMIRKAIDRGVNYVDTAWPYHGAKGFTDPGASEPLVGKALAGGYREKTKLATKLPTWLVKTRADMNRFLDLQLKRLQTSCIDFYLAHTLNARYWEAMQRADLAGFFAEARKDGRIRYAGFSFHDRFAVFQEIVEGYDWDFAQIQYNYLDQAYQAGAEGLRLAARKGLGLVIMEPLRGGFLINQVPDAPRARLAGVRPAWSMADWALRWLWNQPEISVVLSGMSTMDQVEENLNIADSAGPFTDADEAAVALVRDAFRSRIKAGCTGCGYCLPCPEGVNIPRNLTLYNDYFLTDSEKARGHIKYVYGNLILAPGETADHCRRCGQCEENCPQQLPVGALMADVADLFCRTAKSPGDAL
ncbi:MAG: aldo/keto reductase [Deltaproteobacteria bacterium]|jgi:predicted aldo/keto reductase-like oxidoreductase|nr:aldo/keto reductase [Deltaproteobacteria bacterium]